MKKVHIDPLSDRVVVMPEEVDDKTASGIILPDTAKEKPQMGKIIAAGPGKVDRKSTRLNSSHKPISYAVFCLKKKKL